MNSLYTILAEMNNVETDIEGMLQVLDILNEICESARECEARGYVRVFRK